jgi:hypothetical protein
MAKYPQWDGKVYKRAKFGDISIKGPAKEHEMKAAKAAVSASRGGSGKSRRRDRIRSVRKAAAAAALLALYLS